MTKKIKNERDLERKCCDFARKNGLIILKLESNGHLGQPDRVIFAPSGDFLLVEFKSPNKKGRASKEQIFWKEYFSETPFYRGKTLVFIDSYDSFVECVTEKFCIKGI